MELRLLHYLDVSIGFAAVMLAASSVVTLLTQFVLSCLRMRSRLLEAGLARLLAGLHPVLAPHAAAIARALVAGEAGGRPRELILREDLPKRLLELAAAPGTLPPAALAGLRLALQIDAAAALAALESELSRLESEHPHWARHVVRTRALVATASGPWLHGLMARFDESAARWSERFARHARSVSAVIGLLLAGLLPLDSIDLITRLASDQALRAQWTAQAARRQAPQVPADLSWEDVRRAAGAFQAESKPFLPEGWWPAKVTDEVGKFHPGKLWLALAGVLLSAALLALGAPVWFEILKNLLRLRPPTAREDETARLERATSQPNPA
jgi:hypothetical protein